MPQAVFGLLLMLGVACGEPQSANHAARPAHAAPDPVLRPPRKKAEPPEPAPAERPATAPATAPPAPPPPEYSLDATLRLNQVQVKGTHNSYHLRPDRFVSATANYDMPALEDQAGLYGVRAFELDLHWRNGRFEVFHVPGDANTNCLPLTDCIDRLRAWSVAHPGHLPLFVFLELKFDATGDPITNHLDDLDALLANRWPSDWVFTPDDSRGSSATLKAALLDHGWPRLGEVRGQAIFVLMAPQDVLKRYAHDNTGLAGRAMFPLSGDPSWPHAVITDYGDIVSSAAEIPGVVAQGYIVRTRGDDVPTLGNDYPARFQMALDSGAQLVYTDYPAPEASAGYDADMPGGTPARCNPQTAPSACAPEMLENPGRLVLPYP